MVYFFHKINEEGFAETTWPNWVDLIVVTIILRTSYVGFGRGVLAEFLNLFGLVSATALTCNFYGAVSRWLSPWWRGDPAVLEFVCFLVLLLAGLFIVHFVLRKVADVIKWERIHWLLQGIGLTLGAIRGLWWSGLVLLIMLSLGLPYLGQSIQERSVLGPHLAKVARATIDRVADQYPGHLGRVALIPAITLHLPKLPE